MKHGLGQNEKNRDMIFIILYPVSQIKQRTENTKLRTKKLS